MRGTVVWLAGGRLLLLGFRVLIAAHGGACPTFFAPIPLGENAEEPDDVRADLSCIVHVERAWAPRLPQGDRLPKRRAALARRERT